jgi:hypothetical protein
MAEQAKIDAEMVRKGERNGRESLLPTDSGLRFARMIFARVIVNESLICSARP